MVYKFTLSTVAITALLLSTQTTIITTLPIPLSNKNSITNTNEVGNNKMEQVGDNNNITEPTRSSSTVVVLKRRFTNDKNSSSHDITNNDITSSHLHRRNSSSDEEDDDKDDNMEVKQQTNNNTRIQRRDVGPDKIRPSTVRKLRRRETHKPTSTSKKDCDDKKSPPKPHRPSTPKPVQKSSKKGGDSSDSN